jgi:NADH:ubiquinone oxidoreductase subunit 3 (subunit A)
MGNTLPIAPAAFLAALLPDQVEHPWATIAVLLVAAFVFGTVPLTLAWIWARMFSPAKPGREKNAVYECGLEAKGDAWIQLNVSYYLYAIVFLVFDVEAVFLLPFAAAFTGLSLANCLAMLVFLFLLVEGLIWACQKGVLSWG